MQWAEVNAKDNGTTNCEFMTGSVERVFSKVPVSGDECAVIIDPPQVGCSADFIEQLLHLGPKILVYVSCNLQTQMRDIALLRDKVFHGQVQSRSVPRISDYTEHVGDEDMARRTVTLFIGGKAVVMGADGSPVEAPPVEVLPERNQKSRTVTGYHLVSYRCFDMFPQTHRVEAVAVLSDDHSALSLAMLPHRINGLIRPLAKSPNPLIITIMSRRTGGKSSRSGRPPSGQRGSGDAASGHDVRLSKSLSYILRHGAEKEGLRMRADGYVKLDELDIASVVSENDKKRFTLRREDVTGAVLIESNDGEAIATEEARVDRVGDWYIRANQGHSVKVEGLDLELVENVEDIPTVIHGTYLRHWPSIAKKGLSKMGRTHIHFASGLLGDNGVISGMRSDCNCYIYIDVAKAME
ncbi:hypothetical protein HDU93_003486, partial [Gonapodya sp. JEL0774]